MNKLKESIFSLLIKLRLLLGDFHVFIWRHKIVKKTFHSWVSIPKNAELKDIHRGRRAFIIGNGPSVLKQDLTKLNGEIIFVLNNFVRHPQFHQINPTYLCNSDTGGRFGLFAANELNYLKEWDKLYKQLNTFKTVLLFNKASEKIHKKYHLFQKHKIYYLRPSSLLLPPLWKLTYCPTDLTLPLSGHNRAFIDIALMAACYMGIKKIYLLGMDGQPIRSFKDYVNYNFYGKDPFVSMKEYKRLYQFHITSKIYKKSREGLYEKSIACVKRTFAKKGVKIYNATDNRGSLTGFRHVNFEDIIKDK